MDEKEKDKIRSHLTDLSLHTDCCADFLTFFHENEILTMADIESIAAKNEGTPRAAELYKIIQTRPDAYPVLLKGLSRYKQFKALEILTGNMKGTPTISEEEMGPRVKNLLRDVLGKSGISYNYSPPVHLFTGRRKELAELHEMVQKSKEGNRITVISQLTTVSGLGGIGKTQLARQYIQERREEFDENIIWLNAESQHTLSESFRSLAVQKLNLSTKDANGKEKSGKAIAEDVYKYFEGSRALFVLDNAENSGTGPATPVSSSWLYDFLPNPNRSPDLYTLITSRNTEWGIGMKIIKLDVFTNDEAMAMVKFGLSIKEGDDYQDDIILKLVETLQCFPLALHQAISYIYEQRQIPGEYSIQDYISEFETTKQEMMLSYRDVDSLDDTYMLTTTTTWKITVDKIRAHPEFGVMSIFLLNVMSYYSTTNIWRDLFYDLKRISDLLDSDVKPITKDDVNASIQLLVKYSMINSTSQDQSILTIHRLVQAVTRFQMEQNDEDTPFLAAFFFLNDFCQNNGITFHVKNIDHEIALWRHSWKHEKEILPLRALFLDALDKMMKCGRLDEGIDLCDEALAKYKEVFNTEIEFYFKIKQMQAVILCMQGGPEEAANPLKELLDKARLTFGEESERFQSLELDISRVLNSLGKGDKNLNSMIQNLNLKKASFGENSNSTLKAQNALATYQMDNGLDNDALKTFEDLIMKYKTVYGANHATTLDAEANVAKIYFKIGRKEEGLRLFQKVHEKFLNFQERDLFFVARSCLTYADMLGQVERVEDAVNILENCYKKLKEMYGGQHLMMPELLDKIGLFRLISGKFKEALDIHWKTLEEGKAVFGETSFKCLTYKKSIAFDLLYLGKIKESISLLNEVQDQIAASKMFDQGDFVLALRRSGNDIQALELIIRLKSLQKEKSGNENILEMFSEEINLIRQKIEMKKKIKAICSSALQADISFENANLKLLALLDISSEPFRENPDLFALTGLFIARFDNPFKRFQENLGILQKVYSMEKHLLINQKPVLNVLIAIGDVYFGMKNYEQAFDNHNAVYEKLSDIHGDLYVTTIETKIRLATDLFCKGSHEKSNSLFEEIAKTLHELEANNPNANDLTLNMLNYAMETVTILFKDGNPRSKKYLEVIEKNQESLEPKVLNDQLSRAEECITKGNYEDALKVYKDVYRKGDSPIWKAEMCEVASACKNLAHVLNQLGKHEEALEILEGNLELVKINLGSEHHWTHLLQESLANAYRGLGNVQESLRLHEEAVITQINF